MQCFRLQLPSAHRLVAGDSPGPLPCRHDWWRWWGRGPPGDGPPGSQRQTPPDAQQQQQEQEQQPRLRRWQRWWQQVWQWPPHRATYAAGAAVAGAVMPLISWLDEHGDELEAQLQQAVVAA